MEIPPVTDLSSPSWWSHSLQDVIMTVFLALEKNQTTFLSRSFWATRLSMKVKNNEFILATRDLNFLYIWRIWAKSPFPFQLPLPLERSWLYSKLKLSSGAEITILQALVFSALWWWIHFLIIANLWCVFVFHPYELALESDGPNPKFQLSGTFIWTLFLLLGQNYLLLLEQRSKSNTSYSQL